MRVDLLLVLMSFATLGFSATVANRRPKNAPSPLSSHLLAPTTFYRAITGGQFPLARDIYPLGKSPTTHGHTSGDFSQIGAMYVFADRERAMTYGSCYAKLNPMYKQWYIVHLSYIPNDDLKVKTFHEADREWKLFIQNNYTHKKPQHDYDIVEGAYSYGADGTDQVEVWLDPVTGELVWQGAFIGQNALHTLLVEELSLHSAPGDPIPDLLEHVFSLDLKELPLEEFIMSECMQTALPPPAAGIVV